MDYIVPYLLGTASGIWLKNNESKIIYWGLSAMTFFNDWVSNIKEFFTMDYHIKAAAYIKDEHFTLLNESDFEITKNGIFYVSTKTPLENLPILISYTYDKKPYILELKDARKINELLFKPNEKNINKLLSVSINSKEVSNEIRSHAGPFGNFYCLSEVLFSDLYPHCEEVSVINELGDLLILKGSDNIISLI